MGPVKWFVSPIICYKCWKSYQPRPFIISQGLTGISNIGLMPPIDDKSKLIQVSSHLFRHYAITRINADQIPWHHHGPMN